MDEPSVSVVGSGEFADLAEAEPLGEALFQGVEMAADSGPIHDAVGIDRLAVTAVTLSGTNGTIKAVFSDQPNDSTSGSMPTGISPLAYKGAFRRLGQFSRSMP
jgi:hypothetical protein